VATGTVKWFEAEKRRKHEAEVAALFAHHTAKNLDRLPQGLTSTGPDSPTKGSPDLAKPPVVFISYSHKDSKWLERAKVHLATLVRNRRIDVWDDTVIRVGDRWRSDIEQAISTCRAALLLLSADFLASEFIHNDELLPILRRARDRTSLVIFGLVVSAIDFENSGLADIQMINSPKRPLNKLKRGEREELLAQVAETVRRTL
jgi:hypothetical protein